MNYSIIAQDGRTVITFFAEGDIHVVGNDHINYDAIVEAVQNDDGATAVSLKDATATIAAKFERLGERVTISGNSLYLDGDPFRGEVANEIINLSRRGLGFEPLVNFVEKCATNPNSESVDQLYNWLTNNSFVITADGDFLAYKGVYNDSDEGEDGNFASCSAGTAIVNGETIKGRIPQKVGDVVEMPRSKVTFDPANGCGAGLHAGTKQYAEGYGNTLIMVKVNPRDVVSVPNDSSFQKLRVCRYEVVDVFDTRYDDNYTMYGWDYNQDEPTPFVIRGGDGPMWDAFDAGYENGYSGDGFGINVEWSNLSPQEQDDFRAGFQDGRHDWKVDMGQNDAVSDGMWN